MKLILIIIHDENAHALADKFVKKNIRATKLASTGGFLKTGNATFIVGIEAARVDEVLEIVKTTSSAHQEVIPNMSTLDLGLSIGMADTTEVTVGGATVFVLPIDSFHKF
ncbi:MAG: cyclic-di-AMP receptor [Lactobacillales bacterium]|jgi:uncharacterized protein YaaQ|nr:cyclic-di-AMP receptor [Lactobacillales bacterium]